MSREAQLVESERQLLAAQQEIARLNARGQTLEEFFALADRVAGALDVLREARGLPTRDDRWTAPGSVPAEVHADPSLSRAAVVATDYGFRVSAPVTNKGAVQWTPEELARKEALRAKQAATLPTDPVMDALEADDEA